MMTHHITMMSQVIIINKDKSWLVYILQCSDNSYYTGITTDLQRRLHEHNNSKKGAKYTRSRRPVELLYSFIVKNRSVASKEEIKIKKMKRQDKINYFNLRNNKLEK
jgi:putative endonuclease